MQIVDKIMLGLRIKDLKICNYTYQVSINYQITL